MTYNFCQKCCTRFEACETCHAAELAAKDKEIEALKAQIAAIKCCETCKHYYDFKNRKGSACYSCGDDVSYHNWEIRK